MTVASSPLDVESFQKAIHTWFKDKTGLFTIWAEQGAPQPEYPYATLRMSAPPVPAAPQWEERMDTDLSREAGKEIRVRVGIPCQITVSCQAFVGMPDARNVAVDAMSYMLKAQSSLSLPSVRATLKESNIAVTRPLSLLNISGVIADSYVSRANLDVMFGATLNLEEFVGYIDKVAVRSKDLGIDRVFGRVSALDGSTSSSSTMDGALTIS